MSKVIIRKFTLINKQRTGAARQPQEAEVDDAKTSKSATAASLVAKPAVMGVVVGVPVGMSAAGLRPIARVEIMSETEPVTFLGSTGVCQSSSVADPTGIATNALGVNGWANRFSGFQQYRLRSTRWILVPLRTLVGTVTSSQVGGHVGIWIQDSPQVGNPGPTEFQQANRKFVLINQEKIEHLVYSTNEPQDLNLSDIALPPTHTTGATLQQGQHAFQVYGDDTITGIIGLPNNVYTPLFTLTAVYDIEFFGVGGV